MRFFAALLVNGLLAGAIYALLALAFVVVYKASGTINFALGELAGLGSRLAAVHGRRRRVLTIHAIGTGHPGHRGRPAGRARGRDRRTRPSRDHVGDGRSPVRRHRSPVDVQRGRRPERAHRRAQGVPDPRDRGPRQRARHRGRRRAHRRAGEPGRRLPRSPAGRGLQQRAALPPPARGAVPPAPRDLRERPDRARVARVLGYRYVRSSLVGQRGPMTVANGRQFLSIPGPTNIPDAVLQAMHRPAIDIYSGDMVELTRTLLEDLPKLFRTPGRTFIYAANGHGGWEAAVSNVLSRGETVLVLESGVFAVGWGDMARMMGIKVEVLKGDWRRAGEPAAVAQRLAADTAPEIKAIPVVPVAPPPR